MVFDIMALESTGSDLMSAVSAKIITPPAPNRIRISPTGKRVAMALIRESSRVKASMASTMKREPFRLSIEVYSFNNRIETTNDTRPIR
jgi:hypothetical protein